MMFNSTGNMQANSIDATKWQKKQVKAKPLVAICRLPL
jgi:hypothetical protein